MLPEPRYVVTELIGYPDDRSSHRQVAGAPGVSYTVLDRHLNHRIMGTFRSEEARYVSGRLVQNSMRAAAARDKAERLCSKLNAEHSPLVTEPYVPRTRPRSRTYFRPTCPECGLRQDGGMTDCRACGARLFPTVSELRELSA